MNEQGNHKGFLFECYKEGQLEICDFDVAKETLGKSNYGWIGPLDTYLWNRANCKGCNEIYKIAGEPATKLAFYVHTNSGAPVSMDDAEILLKPKKELTDNTFTSWAHRFNKIFEKPKEGKPLPREYWPMQHIKVANGCSTITRQAYRVHPDRSYFVIAGIDKDCPRKNEFFDWTQFLK